MRLDVGGVDHLRLCRSTTRSEFSEQTLPHSAFGPAYEAVINRRRGPVFRRAIAPPATALDHVHNAADDAAVIDAGLASYVPGQMGLDLRPLIVA